MAYIFQYGSNMSVTRLNSPDRLLGDAKVFGVAKTVELFHLMFTVHSNTNDCAAADIVPSESGRNIYGVVYEVPDYLISRETARAADRKSMDAVEGEGRNYIRQPIELEVADGSRLSAVTYVVKTKRHDLKTSSEYVQHILDGLKEHEMPEEYCRYVAEQVAKNNKEI